MLKTGGKYIHGTAAEKLQYDVYEENKVLKAKQNQRNNNRTKYKIVRNVILVFALTFLVIYRYAVITEMNYNIDKVNDKYNEMKNENSRIKVDIEKQMDLGKIREIAENSLGMHKPDKYQIVYVNVPKEDFAAVSETYANSDKSGNALVGLFNKVVKLAKFLE